MLFDDTSALLRIPSSANAEDVMYLDAMRYAAEMLQLSFDRLCNSLLHLPLVDDGTRHRFLSVSAIQDAWAMIDSGDRLRSLIKSSKLLKAHPELCSSFIESILPIRDLRNTVQHLDHKIPSLAANEWPVWGTLKWFEWQEPPHKGISCLLHAGGHVTKRPMLIQEPARGSDAVGISGVVLGSRGAEVSLHLLRENVFHFSQSLEKIMQNEFELATSTERLADAFLQVTVDFRLEPR
jgi:hypothetical protein